MKVRNHYHKRPSISEIADELNRVIRNEEFNKVRRRSIIILLVVIISTATIFTFYLHIFFVRGESMVPTLNNGDYILAIKTKEVKRGDIIAFKKNGKVFIKRIIASEEEVIDITENGSIFIDDRELKESYILNKSIGEVNRMLPHKVQSNSYFVMGDSRGNSVDSRLVLIGDIHADQIIGKVIFRVCPLF